MTLALAALRGLGLSRLRCAASQAAGGGSGAALRWLVSHAWRSWWAAVAQLVRQLMAAAGRSCAGARGRGGPRLAYVAVEQLVRQLVVTVG